MIKKPPHAAGLDRRDSEIQKDYLDGECRFNPEAGWACNGDGQGFQLGPFDGDVLSFYIAMLAQSLPIASERVDSVAGSNPYPWDLFRLLRLGGNAKC